MWHCYDRYLARFGEIDLASSAEAPDAEQFKKVFFAGGSLDDESAHLTVFTLLLDCYYLFVIACSFPFAHSPIAFTLVSCLLKLRALMGKAVAMAHSIIAADRRLQSKESRTKCILYSDSIRLLASIG